MLRLSLSRFQTFKLFSSCSPLSPLLDTVPTSVTSTSSIVLCVSDLPCVPHMISISLSAALLMCLVACPWQPPPYTDRSVTVSHGQPDFKSHNIVSTILLFLFPSIPPFVSVLLCSVLNTDGPPLHFPIPSFSFGPQTTIM